MKRVIIIFAVIVLLSAAIMPIVGIRKDNGVSKVKSKYILQEIAAALYQYCSINGEYPESLKQPIMVLDDGEIMRRDDQSNPLDSWGSVIIFKKSDNGYLIVSPGRDKIINTKDDLCMVLK